MLIRDSPPCLYFRRKEGGSVGSRENYHDVNMQEPLPRQKRWKDLLSHENQNNIQKWIRQGHRPLIHRNIGRGGNRAH